MGASNPTFLTLTWRSQGVTIPFFQRDRLMCVHEHFETKFGGAYWIRTNDQSFCPDAFLAGRCLRPTRPTLHNFGGNGEIRTHGAISDTTVFKTVAINRTLPHFHEKLHWWTGTDSNHRSQRRQIYSLLVLTTHPPVHYFLVPQRRLELLKFGF